MILFFSGTTHNSVRLPEGPINPTNYSGTQLNFWGVSPGNIPGLANMCGPGGYSTPYESQLGALTNSMLQVLNHTIYRHYI